MLAGWYPDPWRRAPLRWWDGANWTAWTHESAVDVIEPQPGAPVAATQADRRREAGDLFGLLGAVDRIAVVDVETTGLFSKDRVVEVAVVTIDRDGNILDEFECLTNPMRDPGPSWLHGITPSLLSDAPPFEEIADHVAALIDGAVVAAHNLPFDRRLLGYEFDRAGINIDWGIGLDTLRASGGCKLGVACASLGIQLDDAHCALHDARATAQLLLRVADRFDGCRPAAAHPLSASIPRVRTREGRTAVVIERPYVARLAASIQSGPDVAPYVELLERAVADLTLDSDERRELVQLAVDLGLDDRTRERAHKDFLSGLIDAALDDGVVSDDEFEHLCRAAALLEVDDAPVVARTNPYRISVGNLMLVSGLRVCFTGTAQTADGVPIERKELEEHARRHGLQPVGNVSAKDCQLLVAADTSTLSGKAKKAQQFGIPIAGVDDFLTALENGTPLTVTHLPSKGVGLACVSCGRSWIATRRQRDPLCNECKSRQPRPQTLT